MKTKLLFVGLLLSHVAFAGNLPVFTAQPANQTVYPGNNATWTASATGATSYQWIFNGAKIVGATNTTFTVTNAQSTNCGYYLVLAQNATGWVPSPMAYLFLDYSLGSLLPNQNEGRLAFSNTNNNYFDGQISYFTYEQGPPTNGSVQIVAGPQLDEMYPVGQIFNYGKHLNALYTNGYYSGPDQVISNIAPGQVVFYSVLVNYSEDGNPFVTPSTVINLAAGTNGTPAPPAYGVEFPGWPEWPEPWVTYPGSSPNEVRVAGETFSLTNAYTGYTDFGEPTFQWRKNGVELGSPQSFTPIPDFPEGATCTAILTITNAQPSDSGVYDVDVRGNDWFIGQKIYVTVQTANGQGAFQKPSLVGTNFICSLLGAPTRSYDIQWSSNLLNWTDLMTISNAAGTITFTDTPSARVPRFYRTTLVGQ